MARPEISYRRSVFLGLVLLLVCGAFAAGSYRTQWDRVTPLATDASLTTPPSHQADAAITDRVPVRVFQVGRPDAIQERHSLTGIVRARYETREGFRVSGKIAKRWVEVGQAVDKGQLLFELDDEDYQLQLKTAEANLQIANANVVQTTADEKRQRQLLASNAISPSEYERSIAARDAALGQQISAQKQQELAANQIEHCKLKADFSGIVLAIEAEAGQVVAIGDHVCTLAKTDELEAVVDVPENRVPRDTKLNASVQFWSFPGLQVRAKLREISPIADPLARTYRSRFTLINPSPDVKLGMTTTVTWQDACHAPNDSSESFAIPTSSIYQRDGEPAIWVVEPDSGQLTSLPVRIERLKSTDVIVRCDLTPGQLVVSAGAHKLDAGQRVRVWERQE